MKENGIPVLVDDRRATCADIADDGLIAMMPPTSYNFMVCPNVLRLRPGQNLADAIIELYNNQLEPTGCFSSEPPDIDDIAEIMRAEEEASHV
jgi:hypothetical protein